MKRVSKLRPGLRLLMMACALAACSGSLFQSKAGVPTTYLLSIAGGAAGVPAAGVPAAGGPPTDVLPVDLAVLKPKVRVGLENDRIAVLYPDRRLDYFAGSRWSGSLGEVLQDLAVREFQSHAGLARVSGDASVFASAYWLEIEVLDFQAEYSPASAAPTVHVRLQARIGNSGDRQVLGQFEADVQRPAAENRLSSIVDAYAEAADSALAQIAVSAHDALAKNPRAQ